MPPEDAASPDSENQADSSKDGLLGELESILEEEGLELDVPELTEEDLLVPAPDSGETNNTPTSPNKRRKRKTDQRRRARSTQRHNAFQEVGSHLQTAAMGLEVAKDKMAVRITKLTKDNTIEEVLALLAENNITAGIDKEAILNALGRARRGQNQFEVLVAQGKLPVVRKKSRVAYHLPKEFLAKATGDEDTPFERLKTLLEEGTQEGLKAWKGPVKMVSKGELVCELKKSRIRPRLQCLRRTGQPRRPG